MLIKQFTFNVTNMGYHWQIWEFINNQEDLNSDQ